MYLTCTHVYVYTHIHKSLLTVQTIFIVTYMLASSSSQFTIDRHKHIFYIIAHKLTYFSWETFFDNTNEYYDY